MEDEEIRKYFSLMYIAIPQIALDNHFTNLKQNLRIFAPATMFGVSI